MRTSIAALSRLTLEKFEGKTLLQLVIARSELAQQGPGERSVLDNACK
jgi:hypothetical protein